MGLAAALCQPNELSLEARNRLVMEQLPQVRYIAQKIHARLPHHIPLEDLINTGVLGLIEALAKFDPTRNVGLPSYARYRIQGAILDSLREQDWSPRLLRQKGRQLEQAREALRGRLGRNPLQAEIAVELDISEDQLNELLSELKGLEITSLQEPVFSDGHVLAETMADTAGENPFELCQTAEMNELLVRALAKLPSRKRHILDLYYFKGMTMKEVGTQLGVCESRISQIHSAAVASLKARMHEVLAVRQKQLASRSRSAIKSSSAQEALEPLPSRKTLLSPRSERARPLGVQKVRRISRRHVRPNLPLLRRPVRKLRARQASLL